MKTVGERIRQAREARGLSQGELASKAGFAHQSAIGNLETRATGRGGFRLSRIAEALEVPVEWLLAGPDSVTIPHASQTWQVAEAPRPRYADSPELARAIALIRSLDAALLPEALTLLEYLASKKKPRSTTRAGRAVPAPSKRAA